MSGAMSRTGRGLRFATLALLTLLASMARAGSDPSRCLDAAPLPRVARVVAADGAPVYARVVSQADGVPTAVSGRQRMQGRKPASPAAAGVEKKRAFSTRGGGTGQTGRQ